MVDAFVVSAECATHPIGGPRKRQQEGQEAQGPYKGLKGPIMLQMD